MGTKANLLPTGGPKLMRDPRLTKQGEDEPDTDTEFREAKL
jgi:hypothetical protein